MADPQTAQEAAEELRDDERARGSYTYLESEQQQDAEAFEERLRLALMGLARGLGGQGLRGRGGRCERHGIRGCRCEENRR